MLPVVEADEEWDTVVPDESVMRPGAEDLCTRLGLGGAALTLSRTDRSRCAPSAGSTS